VRVTGWFAAAVPEGAYHLTLVSEGGQGFSVQLLRRGSTPSDGSAAITPRFTVSTMALREHAPYLGRAIVAILDDAEVAEVFLLSGADRDAVIVALAEIALREQAITVAAEEGVTL